MGGALDRDWLDRLPPLREVIARHGLSARRSLGQNFLLDRNLLARVARVPGSLDGASVYEVGPGPGGLTAALLAAGACVVAVEQDARAIPALAELAEMADGRLRVVQGDALDVDERQLLPDGGHVVSNLPYNVGTALLVRWLTTEEWPPWWKSLTLMFQREVAERIVAAPGTESYGRLSVLAQWRAKPRIALTLPARAFTPPPKVDSAVVHIVPAEAPDGVPVHAIEAVTAAAFGQRRKMLRASLRSLNGGVEALAAAEIAPDRRAETLAIGEFVRLARAWAELQNPEPTSLPARD